MGRAPRRQARPRRSAGAASPGCGSRAAETRGSRQEMSSCLYHWLLPGMSRTHASKAIDPVDLEILWNGLVMIVDEGAFAIIRTSMSKVVVEGRDFGAMLYDPQGRLLAADVSIASKTGATSIVVKQLLKHFPIESLRPGDILATNNPWWIMGHLNDVAIVAPIFYKKKLVAFAE